VVVTNQSVVGRGLLTVDGLHELHHELLRQLSVHSVCLDGIYYCPEVPHTDDPMMAGKNAGCRGCLLVRTGYGAGVEPLSGFVDHTASDLRAAADWILMRSSRPTGDASSKAGPAE
jgi:hypothetical protein